MTATVTTTRGKTRNWNNTTMPQQFDNTYEELVWMAASTNTNDKL